MILPNQREEGSVDKREYKTRNFELDKKVINKYSGKKYFLKTYGCQMNERDSETLSALIEKLGFERVEDYREKFSSISISLLENDQQKFYLVYELLD